MAFDLTHEITLLKDFHNDFNDPSYKRLDDKEWSALNLQSYNAFHGTSHEKFPGFFTPWQSKTEVPIFTIPRLPLILIRTVIISLDLFLLSLRRFGTALKKAFQMNFSESFIDLKNSANLLRLFFFALVILPVLEVVYIAAKFITRTGATLKEACIPLPVQNETEVSELPEDNQVASLKPTMPAT